MGHCIITIEVMGAHHNGLPNDIDRLAHEFVKTLNKNGHSVTHCMLFSNNSTMLLTEPMPLSEEGIRQIVARVAKAQGGVE